MGSLSDSRVRIVEHPDAPQPGPSHRTNFASAGMGRNRQPRTSNPLMELSAKAVETIFVDCLFTKEEVALKGEKEPPENAVMVEGIMRTFGFHRERLEGHREDVKELLAQLPSEFQQGVGGGWSFLNACMTKDSKLWGEHIHMEELFCPGIGLGLAKWQFRREMWSSLPGSMPYVTVML